MEVDENFWTRLDAMGTAVLAVAALIVVGLLIEREVTDGQAPRSTDGIEFEVLDARAWRFALDGRHVRGRRSADVMIVEFGSFSCRWCKVLGKNLKRLLGEEDGGSVGVVFRHFPGDPDEISYRAAVASECAARQRRFWEFHDHVLDHQQDLSPALLRRAGEEIGVDDPAAYRECLAQREPRDAVEEDLRAADRLGVEATPTLVINRRMMSGAPPTMEGLRTLQAEYAAP